MTLRFKSDGVLERIGRQAAKAPAWLPRAIHGPMKALKPQLVETMQDQMWDNRYTGKLSQSVKGEYTPSAMELTVGPTLKRGQHDGGLLLELGARPIPNAPWRPIKRWAAMKGLDPFPIWYKIRTKGVDAHPFVEKTLQAALDNIRAAGQAITDAVVRRLFSLKEE